jgi:hypothetical protein
MAELPLSPYLSGELVLYQAVGDTMKALARIQLILTNARRRRPPTGCATGPC